MNISTWHKSVATAWYFGVQCKKCATPILFAVDRTGDNTWVPTEKLVLTCSSADCRHQADYSKAQVSRFQKTDKVK
jgi:hypothetical protein